MARHAWFWHAAILSQTTSVTCVRKEGETKQFQKSFEPSQWWSSDNALCLLLGKKNSEASKWEWKNDKWQATQITLSWFCCVGEPRLARLLCHAPWHILCARHGSDFTTCSVFACDWMVCLWVQTVSGNSVIIYSRWLHIYCSHISLKLRKALPWSQ